MKTWVLDYMKQTGAGAFSGAIDAVKTFYELLDPANEQPITISSMIWDLNLERAFMTKAILFVFCGPHDVLNTIKNLATYPDNDFFNQYTQYIWAQQMFHFGSSLYTGKQDTEVQVMPAGKRVMNKGDSLLWIVFMRDQAGQTAQTGYSWQLKYKVTSTEDMTALGGSN